MTQYLWNEGARFGGVDAQRVGERIEQLQDERGGRIRPEEIVQDAESSDSPLHRCFEWNDAKAAQAFRVDQARLILRSLVIKSGPKVPMASRAFVAVMTGADKASEKSYVAIGDALEDPVLREQVLDSARRELRSLRAKYARLQELARIFEAIDQLEIEQPA